MNINDLPPKYSSLLFETGVQSTRSDDPIVQMSISTELAANFIPIELKFSDITRIAFSSLNYSPVSFKEGYRLSTNALEGSNLIVLDIDDGWTVRQAWDFIDDQDYLALITTTKSHNLPKNNEPPRDRFRIFLPTKQPFKGTQHEYRFMMQNIFRHFKDKPDKATCDMSRFFYGNSNPDNRGFLNVDGFSLLDLDKFDKFPKLSKTENKLIKRNGDCSGLEKYWINKAVVGERNNILFCAYAFYKEKNMSEQAICEKISYLNSKISNPLPQEEIDVLCRIKK